MMQVLRSAGQRWRALLSHWGQEKSQRIWTRKPSDETRPKTRWLMFRLQATAKLPVCGKGQMSRPFRRKHVIHRLSTTRQNNEMQMVQLKETTVWLSHWNQYLNLSVWPWRIFEPLLLLFEHDSGFVCYTHWDFPSNFTFVSSVRSSVVWKTP